MLTIKKKEAAKGSVKPKEMKQEHWNKVELPQLQKELAIASKKEEFETMNAAALEATKSKAIKRQASHTKLHKVDGKKLQADAVILDSELD